MAFNYIPDMVALEPEPALADFHAHFKAGSHEPAHNSQIGKEIYKLLTSRIGVAMIAGAVIAAPSRPPVIAPEPLLFKIAGEDAFSDEMKKYVGRVVRYIVEHLGGRWVRRGVKVIVPSRYGSGSIYSFS